MLLVSLSPENRLAVAAQEICNVGGGFAEDAVLRVAVAAEFRGGGGGGWLDFFKRVG